MRLHLIGIFHTANSKRSSHCAFTGKVLRFAKMMQGHGYEVIEYANASESDAETKVPILTAEELDQLSTRKDPKAFFSVDAKCGSPIWQAFNDRLIPEVKARFDPAKDIICHPFGPAHTELMTLGGIHVETGIGYPTTFAPYRVFESYAWMHYHQGKAGRGGNSFEWVAPNYYDVADWQVQQEAGDYLLYFGRITQDKGMRTIWELAKHTQQKVILCGQGDPTPWVGGNIDYLPPVHGDARSKLLGGARAMLMPTEYTEPFGGAGVEGLLCGTPLISSNHGAFAETVQPGVNGFRCQTLGDYVEAVRRAEGLNRAAIARVARKTYCLETVGARFDKIFCQLETLRGEGWNSLTPFNLP